MRNIFITLVMGIVFASIPFNLPAQEQKNTLTTDKPITYPILDRLKNTRQADLGDQLLGTYLSFMGDSYGAIKVFEKKFRDGESLQKESIPSPLKELDEITKASAENALSAIISEAKNKQIVILNEYHHIPMQRAFAMRLARELRKIGYEYLACETLTTDDLHPLINGYVEEYSGFYSKEPMFANFLRDAIQDRWKFISFEAKFDPTLPSREFAKVRETRMAENIINRILKDNPNAKIFIYTGSGHAYKQPTTESIESRVMMAAHLKRLSGIDPLSIDQTQMIPHFIGKQQAEIYSSAKTKSNENEPFVLKGINNENLVFGRPKGRMDMQVVFPDYKKDPETGRPTWYTAIAGFTPHDIPNNLALTANDRLIYVYHRNDPKNAAPVDVILIAKNKPIPKLMLPKGEFRFEHED